MLDFKTALKIMVLFLNAFVCFHKFRMSDFFFLNSSMQFELTLFFFWSDENDILKSLTPSAREGAQKILSKARQRTHMQVLGKLTDLVDEKYLLKENAPFIVRETKAQTGRPIKEALGLFLESYYKINLVF
jgi:hypothetical protein